MKKIAGIIALSLALVFIIGCGSKYDTVANKDQWKKMLSIYDQGVTAGVLKDYLNAVVNDATMDSLINSGIDKEKISFIKSHKHDMKKVLQVFLALQMTNANVNVNDNQYVIVTGILNDNKAIAAKNGIQYQQEKAFLRNFQLYSIAEYYRGHLPETTSTLIDSLHKG
jgi:hypothetical protein